MSGFSSRLSRTALYLLFPKHMVQVALLGFFGTVWNIGFVATLVGGMTAAMIYLAVLLAIGAIVQISFAALIFKRPGSFDDVRKMSLWKWSWIKTL